MIDDFVAGAVEAGGEPTLGQGHPYRVGEALPQRAGGDFHAGSLSQFGMAGGLAAPLPESLKFVNREVVPGQVQQGIEQGRGVSGGQHKTVAVRPLGVGGVVLQELVPKDVSHRGGAHRRPGMPGACLLDSIHGQEAQGVDA